LQPGGWLFLEIGADQQAAVQQLFRQADQAYDHIDVMRDYAGRPRVARARSLPRAAQPPT
jgi:release factor glutamine methyltransferase